MREWWIAAISAVWNWISSESLQENGHRTAIRKMVERENMYRLNRIGPRTDVEEVFVRGARSARIRKDVITDKDLPSGYYRSQMHLMSR